MGGGWQIGTEGNKDIGGLSYIKQTLCDAKH